MTAQIGDEVMIMPEGPDQPVRQGEIRGVRNDPGGVVYIVQWSDTGHQSLVPHGPGIVIKHRHGHGSEVVATGVHPEPSRLRHPLEWRHRQERERHQHVRDERLAWRVQDIFTGVGLDRTDFSVAGGRVVHIPQVVSVHAGPPVELDIRMLPGQSPDDYSAHAKAIAYHLGMAEMRVIPLEPSLIRLQLVPQAPLTGKRAAP